MGVYINNKIILERQKEKQEETTKAILLKEMATLRLENKQKDIITKNVMQQLAEIRLNLIQKEGR